MDIKEELDKVNRELEKQKDRERQAKRYKNKKEEILKKDREWRAEHGSEYYKKYYKANKDKILQRQKERYHKNKQKSFEIMKIEDIIEEIDRRVVNLSNQAEKMRNEEAKQYTSAATTLVLLKMWIKDKINKS